MAIRTQVKTNTIWGPRVFRNLTEGPNSLKATLHNVAGWTKRPDEFWTKLRDRLDRAGEAHIGKHAIASMLHRIEQPDHRLDYYLFDIPANESPDFDAVCSLQDIPRSIRSITIDLGATVKDSKGDCALMLNLDRILGTVREILGLHQLLPFLSSPSFPMQSTRTAGRPAWLQNWMSYLRRDGKKPLGELVHLTWSIVAESPRHFDATRQVKYGLLQVDLVRKPLLDWTIVPRLFESSTQEPVPDAEIKFSLQFNRVNPATVWYTDTERMALQVSTKAIVTRLKQSEWCFTNRLDP